MKGWLFGFVLWAIAVGTIAAEVGIGGASAADLQRTLLALILTGLFVGGVISVLQRQWYASTYWIAFVVATMVAALDANRAHVETFLLSFAWMVYWIRSRRVSRAVVRPSAAYSAVQAVYRTLKLQSD
jgi:hypothetical protein